MHPQEKILELLESTVRNILTQSDKARLNSISVPAISTGIFAVPATICAKATCSALTNHISVENNFPKIIRLIFDDEKKMKIYQKELENIQK